MTELLQTPTQMEVPTYIFIEMDYEKKKALGKINSSGFCTVNWLLMLFEKNIKYSLAIGIKPT